MAATWGLWGFGGLWGPQSWKAVVSPQLVCPDALSLCTRLLPAAPLRRMGAALVLRPPEKEASCSSWLEGGRCGPVCGRRWTP